MAFLSYKTVKTEKLICIFLFHIPVKILHTVRMLQTLQENEGFYSEIVFLGFVKTHFYSMCILD